MSSSRLRQLQSSALAGVAISFAMLTGFAASARAQVVISPDKLIFHCKAGHQCAPREVTLKNVGSGTVTLSSITVTGRFVLTNDCPQTLTPGQSCNMTLSVGSAGSFTGMLLVNDNAPNSPQEAFLRVIEEGVS
jgi:hypothetical protein